MILLTKLCGVYFRDSEISGKDARGGEHQGKILKMRAKKTGLSEPGKNGGRYRVRTCDFYRVKVALSR